MWWMIDVTSFEMKGKTIPLTTAIVDSGTSIYAGSPSVVNAIK